MSEEERIYVVVPAVVEVARQQWVIQPAGRQIAQACHVSAKLRHELGLTTMESEDGKFLIPVYDEITTIILAARDSKEMMHAFRLLTKRKLFSTFFSDQNPEAYGSDFRPITALATYASPSQVEGILDYLPLWGS